MTLASFWELSGTFLTVLTPLAAVPLTVITFYLRSIREQQMSWHTQWVRRLEAAEASMAELRRTLSEFERDYAAKEEWLRECMYARRKLEQLGETVIRLETLVETQKAETPKVHECKGGT